MKFIVGLGNPGEKYKNTRHNLGFMVIEALARQFLTPNAQFSIKKEFNSAILRLKNYNEEFFLIKPQTMMNSSGFTVSKIASFYKLKPEDIWIVHDDIDLPLGKIKIRFGGAAAGHHGLESIIRQLGTDKFVRFRLGIGHPGHNGKYLVEKYVLKPFEKNELVEIKKMIRKMVKAISTSLNDGLEKAMNHFNQ